MQIYRAFICWFSVSTYTNTHHFLLPIYRIPYNEYSSNVQTHKCFINIIIYTICGHGSVTICSAELIAVRQYFYIQKKINAAQQWNLRYVYRIEIHTYIKYNSVRMSLPTWDTYAEKKHGREAERERKRKRARVK